MIYRVKYEPSNFVQATKAAAQSGSEVEKAGEPVRSSCCVEANTTKLSDTNHISFIQLHCCAATAHVRLGNTICSAKYLSVHLHFQINITVPMYCVVEVEDIDAP